MSRPMLPSFHGPVVLAEGWGRVVSLQEDDITAQWLRSQCFGQAHTRPCNRSLVPQAPVPVRGSGVLPNGCWRATLALGVRQCDYGAARSKTLYIYIYIYKRILVT